MSYKISTFFLVILITVLTACEKKPYMSFVDGYVLDKEDSLNIAFATIKLMHWDGSEDGDTNLILQIDSDSLGKFDFSFEADDRSELYKIFAVKEGYINSNWQHIDVGWTNSCNIKLKKEQE